MSDESPNQHQNQDLPRAESSAAPSSAAHPKRSRFRLWARRAGFFALGGLLFAGITLGSAEWYTGRPQFCGTCHVMDPYYESWSHDIHGARIGAKCIDCHYAPGERTTLNAKFRGLSQVASYFSGRYGAGRPRAHVSDDSCLVSGCHGDRSFDTKMLAIGKPQVETRMVGGAPVEMQRPPSVHFVHAKHLDVEPKRAEIERESKSVRERLARTLDEPTKRRVEQIASSVRPAAERRGALDSLASEKNWPVELRHDATALMELEHRRIRLDQLAGLNCSACHAFNPTLSSHIAADRNVCYTCHFTHEDFNRNTGECLRCHEPPTRAVSIHGTTSTPGGGAVVMDHQDIVKRGVDCASCHADVLRGGADVSERDCTHCHDQARFLADFATRTTETVRVYHAVHIAGQKAHCFDCHRAIQHGLLSESDFAGVQTSAGFLQPVLSDCKHCHPNHHSEQVALLTGTGGVGLAHSTPSGMLGSRLNCRACHTQPAADEKGDTLIRATQEGCIACHGEEYRKLFEQWQHEVGTYLSEAEALLDRVTKLSAAHNATPVGVRELLAAAGTNIRLVRAGGGLHNRPYALQLLDVARRKLIEAEQLLASAPQ